MSIHITDGLVMLTGKTKLCLIEFLLVEFLVFQGENNISDQSITGFKKQSIQERFLRVKNSLIFRGDELLQN